MTTTRAPELPLRVLLSGVSLGLALILVQVGGAAPVRADEVPAPAPTASATPEATPETATPEVAAVVAAAPAAEVAAPAPAPAAAAAPAVTYALGDRILRVGDAGADVVALQALLKVGQTGTFDVPTRKAVTSVQRKAGIQTHGVVGPKTLKAIRKPAAKKRAAEASSRSLPRTGTPARNRAYARVYIARQYGWGSAQMACLTSMWIRESGWRHNAHNPNGRYHGIPQTSSAVWRSAGYSTATYMSSPAVQIKVGATYIKSRYGTPCAAWSFWRAHHWY